MDKFSCRPFCNRCSKAQALGTPQMPLVLFILVTAALVATSGLANSRRDESRILALGKSHQDYPDYKRPDKEPFRGEGTCSTYGRDLNAIVVKFENGLDPADVDGIMLSMAPVDNEIHGRFSGFSSCLRDLALLDFVDKASNVSSEVMEKDRLQAEYFAGRQLPDRRLYFVIHLRENPVPVELINCILDEQVVELAYYQYILEPIADIPPTTNNFADPPGAEQKHLNDNTTDGGIGAREIWQYNGGDGEGVRVGTYEDAATTDHEDLPPMFATIGDYSPRQALADHGVAVLGMIGARDNGYGMTGVAPQASLMFASSSNTDNFSSLMSSTYTRAGDVVSISLAVGGCPVTNSTFYRTTIEEAVLRGVLVFIGAGNENKNIDSVCQPSVSTSAAIVGGGSPNSSHWFQDLGNGSSSWGASIRLQGWYTSIATLGYGHLFGNTHDVKSIYFPEFVGNPNCGENKSEIPDGSVILLGDYYGSSSDGDDIVSCWPLSSTTCIWHVTRNLTTTGDQTEFDQTSLVGGGSVIGNLNNLYVYDNFNLVGNDELVYWDISSSSLKSMNLAQYPYPVAQNLPLGTGSTIPQSTDQLFAADTDGDGDKDLIISRQSGTKRTWWKAVNALVGTVPTFPSGFQQVLVGGATQAYRWTDIIVFGDYDLDGKDDLIAIRNGDYNGREWMYSSANSSGSFNGWQKITPHGQGWLRSDYDGGSWFEVTNILAGRLDGDGEVDFLARKNAFKYEDDNAWDGAWFFRAPISSPEIQLYTENKSGTSFSTPMVAGAAADIQGLFRADGGSGCDQETMMYLLEATGEPQGENPGDPTDWLAAGRIIGTFPSLSRAAEYIFLHSNLLAVGGLVQSGVSSDVPLNGDIDGDGLDDLFYYRPSTQIFYYARNQGVPYFSSPSTASIDFSAFVADTISVGDINGDGRDDILGKTSYNYWVYCENGTTTNAAFVCYFTKVGGSIATFALTDRFMLGDVNGDGFDDFVVRSSSTNSWWWAEFDQIQNVFTSLWPLNIGGTSSAVYSSTDLFKFADISGDGYDDLVAKSADDSWWASMNNQNNSLRMPIKLVIDGALDEYDIEDKFAVGTYEFDISGGPIPSLVVRKPSNLRWFLNRHVTKSD